MGKSLSNILRKGAIANCLTAILGLAACEVTSTCAAYNAAMANTRRGAASWNALSTFSAIKAVQNDKNEQKVVNDYQQPSQGSTPTPVEEWPRCWTSYPSIDLDGDGCSSLEEYPGRGDKFLVNKEMRFHCRDPPRTGKNMTFTLWDIDQNVVKEVDLTGIYEDSNNDILYARFSPSKPGVYTGAFKIDGQNFCGKSIIVE